MWSDIVSLFDGYGMIPMIIMLFGVLLCIVEVFIPGFGLFGVLGGICSIGGIVARMFLGASLTQFLIMILLFSSLIVLAIISMFISARCGLIKYSPIVEEKTSVPVNYGKDNKQLVKTLLGKTTFASTEFKPIGKFSYNGEMYEATTYGEFVSKGEKIQIVEIKADKIFIKVANGVNGKTK